MVGCFVGSAIGEGDGAGIGEAVGAGMGDSVGTGTEKVTFAERATVSTTMARPWPDIGIARGRGRRAYVHKSISRVESLAH